MNVRSQEQGEEDQPDERLQLLNVLLAQAEELPDNQAYMDGFSAVPAFKTDKYLSKIKMVPGGIKINCNTGVVMTNKRGKYGRLKVWYIPDGIANIFSMHKLKKMYPITCDSWGGYYKVHTSKRHV